MAYGFFDCITLCLLTKDERHVVCPVILAESPFGEQGLIHLHTFLSFMLVGFETDMCGVNYTVRTLVSVPDYHDRHNFKALSSSRYIFLTIFR